MIIKIEYQRNKRFIVKKITEKIVLQKQNSRCIQYRDFVFSYVELENRLKATEENLKKISINDSETN